LLKGRGSRSVKSSRRSLVAGLCIAVTASCAVYDHPDGPTDGSLGGAGSGNGGTAIDGGAGAGGTSAAGSGGATGKGGSAGSSSGGGGTGGAGASVDGSAGTGGATGGKGGAGTGGTGGATTGGSGGTGVGGTAGTGDGGSAGTGGTGAGGAGGTNGTDGGTTGGAGGTSGSGIGGSAGAAGAGTGGATGSGGAAGTTGTGGSTTTGGTGGSGAAAGTGGAGTGGTAVDAGPDVAPPGAVFAVGSFTKLTTTGAQTVNHTLGQTPKALVMWTAGKTNETQSAGFLYGFGVADGAEAYSVGISTRDNVAISATSRRMAQKIITLVQGGETLIAEADLTSRTATNFALNWTTNDNQPVVVHYLAIGGPQVTAKLNMWVSPTATGNQAITGVGFKPETVLHFYAGAAYTGPAGTSTFNGIFGLGAMDKNGAQWATQVADWDDNDTTLTSRGQQTDAAIYMYADGSSAAVTKEASFVSMDNDGFTLNFKTANANAGLICSLSLAGVKAAAGNFNKATAGAPASQSVTSAGFKPGAVLFSSFQMGQQSASVSETNFSYGIGASDGVNEGSSALTSANNVATTAVDAIDKTSKALLKMNTPPLDAEADLTSLDATGFTLNWTTNDNVASQIGFWALGAP
jgi:hypothetical protein